eukprot:CAMPEP_0182942674 /NCGR_PEP_ID=MMETSP0105_2-20130417/51109_1 /TAXON_ID=81532 ORGANISM="Acanthoeca-like sp., Strain 10tr" /NCGR_SAMPLE_ID=MMETSP0105_2 /ASSEMBLY_ACC=CAM_ASM_000205 /LENGTH=111 /DNA_ID=CAMNT_0025082437 /DNA_START=282 /DNA_END=614 /DNA_ORIENTATION=+
MVGAACSTWPNGPIDVGGGNPIVCTTVGGGGLGAACGTATGARCIARCDDPAAWKRYVPVEYAVSTPGHGPAWLPSPPLLPLCPFLCRDSSALVLYDFGQCGHENLRVGSW